jgi:hypothetical protein
MSFNFFFYQVVQIAVLDSSSIPPVAIRVPFKFVIVTRSDTKTGGTALGKPLERFFCHSGSNGCEYTSDEHLKLDSASNLTSLFLKGIQSPQWFQSFLLQWITLEESVKLKHHCII